MIRTSYPVSPMKQIRLRLELATRRALEQRRRTLMTELTETERRKAAAADGDVYLLLRWREDVGRVRVIYNEFCEQCDGLIGVLCLAAHQGIDAKFEREYAERRRWFVANYGQRVRGLIAPHLQADAADTVPSLFGRRAVDAFEALYFPATIVASLEQDSGDLIGRMSRAQEALEAWETHLRREEDAVAAPIRFR